jgi:membrane associated rhomboid family serine protease
MKHRIVEELHGVAMFVAAIWAVFLLDLVVPGTFNRFGLAPREVGGLVGIVTMPFLHDGWGHLLGNSVPLIILLSLLAGSRANSYGIVAMIVVLGGALLWMFGRGSTLHVGVSGLIYGLITFLIVAGFREGRIGAILVAVFVGFMYGWTLITGMIPLTAGPNVSWDGHLMGAVAGAIVARIAVKPDAGSTNGSLADLSGL